MNAIELLNADHRVLSGLIGKVWSTEPGENTDPVARENAEHFIRMYLEETLDQHRSRELVSETAVRSPKSS